MQGRKQRLEEGLQFTANPVVDVVPNANTFMPPITRSSTQRALSSRPHAYTRLFTGYDIPHEENVDLAVDGVQAMREAIVDAEVESLQQVQVQWQSRGGSGLNQGPLLNQYCLPEPYSADCGESNPQACGDLLPVVPEGDVHDRPMSSASIQGAPPDDANAVHAIIPTPEYEHLRGLFVWVKLNCM